MQRVLIHVAVLELQWTQVATSTEWTSAGGRQGTMALSLGSSALLMGGRRRTSYFNDVWSSSDEGRSFQLLAVAPWAPRAFACSVYSASTIYVVGGERSSTSPVSPPTT